MISLSIALRSLATIFAKKAALYSAGNSVINIVLNGWFLMEIIALILQALVWTHVLMRLSLSKAYPYMSLVFVLNLLAAWLIFNESIKVNHVLGVIVIIIGVIIVRGNSESKAT